MKLFIKCIDKQATISLLHKGEVTETTWPADRQLSQDLFIKLEMLLKDNNLEMKQIKQIVYNTGPGSFTGLRIGASIANTLGYSLGVPVISLPDADWRIDDSAIDNRTSKPGSLVTDLNYSSAPHITKPRK